MQYIKPFSAVCPKTARAETTVFPSKGAAIPKTVSQSPADHAAVTAPPAYNQWAAAALHMRTRSYAPYSHYHVGAVLVASDGTLFTGCNVENAAYPVGICAERTAFAKAVSEGYHDFQTLVLAGAPSQSAGSDFCTPCGMCRQFIREFCPPNFPILLVKADAAGTIQEYGIATLEELLPHSFGPEQLHP